MASDATLIKAIQFTVALKPGSVTRPLSGTYSSAYLSDRGELQSSTNTIFLPVYGLYDGYTNNVTLTYNFLDGSSKQASLTITTTAFYDPCGYQHPTVLQARTKDTNLSYDYFMVKGRCDNYLPAMLDADGALRWVGTAFISDISATFFQNFNWVLPRLEPLLLKCRGRVAQKACDAGRFLSLGKSEGW